MPGMNHLSRRRFLQWSATGAGGGLPVALLAQAATHPPNAVGKRKHRYEELLPEEFYEEFDRAPIIYLASVRWRSAAYTTRWGPTRSRPLRSVRDVER